MQLGAYEFDAVTGELRRDDLVVRLEPQPAALLRLLLSRPGELIPHDEIRRTIWGDSTHVNFQQGLHYCVRQIRVALDDSAREPRFIHTVPRRGYRLTIPAGASPDRLSPSRRHGVWAAVAAVLVVTTYLVEQRPNRHHEMAVAVLGAVHDFVY